MTNHLEERGLSDIFRILKMDSKGEIGEKKKRKKKLKANDKVVERYFPRVE